MTNNPPDLGPSIDWYVKTPAPVQAMRLRGPSDITAAGEWIKTNGGQCSYVATTYASANVQAYDYLTLHTVEGPQSAFLGDWIVYDRSGGFWAMRDDVFAAVYQPADEVHHVNQ